MSLGFEMAGYEIGLGIDNDNLACQTHAQHFGKRTVCRDITGIDDPVALVREHGLERIDVIIGGPPCQGFSRVGRGKLRSINRHHVNDPRNYLYKEFIRFVAVLRPSFFVMENVPDMQYFTDDGEMLVEKIQRLFQQHGYYTRIAVLSADHYGVPQIRKRLFIIGSHLSGDISLPEKSHEDHPVTVWQAIGDLPIVPHAHRHDEMPYEPRGEPGEYQQWAREGAGDMLYNHQTRWHNAQDLESFAILPEGCRYIDLDKKYRRYRDDIFKDKYRKLFRDQPSWVIEAHIGKDTYRHIYPSRPGEPEPPRTISVREAARLQSFPDRFRLMGPFTRQFYQVGNAVPPLLARAVASALLPDIQRAMADLFTAQSQSRQNQGNARLRSAAEMFQARAEGD